ncbi:hypothetical protein PIB30_004506 [Stylosanthes scabra]|uniref:Uncharacterized protein n=1 Tax=Stylosanthes scabra TaxID=79078 RepID=A0ABU6X3B3_9FABA|nr:hypothetical protein [Stylosanthes scabra]
MLFVCSAPGDQSGEVPWCLFRPLIYLTAHPLGGQPRVELLPATYVLSLASEVALWGFVPLGMLHGGKSSAKHLGGYSRSGWSVVPAFRDLLAVLLSDWFPSCRSQFLPLSILLPAGSTREICLGSLPLSWEAF